MIINDCEPARLVSTSNAITSTSAETPCLKVKYEREKKAKIANLYNYWRLRRNIYFMVWSNVEEIGLKNLTITWRNIPTLNIKISNREKRFHPSSATTKNPTILTNQLKWPENTVIFLFDQRDSNFRSLCFVSCRPPPWGRPEVIIIVVWWFKLNCLFDRSRVECIAYNSAPDPIWLPSFISLSDNFTRRPVKRNRLASIDCPTRSSPIALLLFVCVRMRTARFFFLSSFLRWVRLAQNDSRCVIIFILFIFWKLGGTNGFVKLELWLNVKPKRHTDRLSSRPIDWALDLLFGPDLDVPGFVEKMPKMKCCQRWSRECRSVGAIRPHRGWQCRGTKSHT